DRGGGPRLPEVDDRTEIHKFDTSGPGTPRYVGSGAVDGWLINQYAMSEWDGHLRVATTRGDDRLSESGTTESTVYVLAERDGSLVEVGSVGARRRRTPRATTCTGSSPRRCAPGYRPAASR